MINKFIYIIIIFFSRMPFFVLYLISDFLAFLLNHVIGYRKEVIMDNLRKSFPEKTEEELNKIRVQFNKNFSDQMVETLKNFTISEKQIRKRLTYNKDEVRLLKKYAEQGRSIMLGSAHYGNWEYAIGFPLSVPFFDRYNVVYAPIENRFINDRIIKSREQFGITLMSMKETMRAVKELPNDKQVYGFIYDQSPHKSRVKYDLQFLNQTTPVHVGTELVAKMKNAVVLTYYIIRVKRGYYHVKMNLVTENPNETAQYEITNELFSRLEETIKRDPAQWLWSHRRWKFQPGRDYSLNTVSKN